MNTPIAAQEFKGEDVTAIVSKHQQGHAVALRDDDSGEYVSLIKIFPEHRHADAVAYAQALAEGKK